MFMEQFVLFAESGETAGNRKPEMQEFAVHGECLRGAVHPSTHLHVDSPQNIRGASQQNRVYGRCLNYTLGKNRIEILWMFFLNCELL